jgi:hypothetical protein
MRVRPVGQLVGPRDGIIDPPAQIIDDEVGLVGVGAAEYRCENSMTAVMATTPSRASDAHFSGQFIGPAWGSRSRACQAQPKPEIGRTPAERLIRTFVPKSRRRTVVDVARTFVTAQREPQRRCYQGVHNRPSPVASGHAVAQCGE